MLSYQTHACFFGDNLSISIKCLIFIMASLSCTKQAGFLLLYTQKTAHFHIIRIFADNVNLLFFFKYMYVHIIHATSVVDETLFLFTWRSLGQPHPMWHQPQRSHLPCWVYPYGARPPHHRCLICWIQNSWKPFHVWGLWSKQSTHHRCWSYSQKRKGNRIHQWVTNISWVRCRL